MTHLFAHVRRNALAYVVVVFALGAGGGYALAATNAKTITVCADKKTGVLHLHGRGRCKGSQTRISWNQQGLPGPQGRQGPAGQPGAPAASAWAIVTNSGTVLSGRGLSVQHASAGAYQVSVTAPGCAQGFNAPVVSVSDAYPPNGQGAGAFPVAWVGDNGSNQTVHRPHRSGRGRDIHTDRPYLQPDGRLLVVRRQ